MAYTALLADILRRNLGNVLTPELATGILAALPPESLSTAMVPQALMGDWLLPADLRPSTTRLVVDEHERVATWVAARTGASAAAWAGYVCLGLARGDMLVAGVVLESFTGRNANVHVAGVGGHWLNRNMLATFFHYCFRHLRLRRLTGLTPASNHSALAFNRHLGFEVEYVMPDGAEDGDLVIQVLRPATCRYLARLPQE